VTSHRQAPASLAGPSTAPKEKNMKVLWVYAHPESRSLNAALRDAGVRFLEAQGHEVVLSDLYAMGWNPTLDRDDLGDLPDPAPQLSRATKQAYERGTLAADIRAEQDKLRAADVLVLQFPLWWYSVPAILKGWIDRVFAKGFAYGIADPEHPGRTLRYGDGPLSGRRAQVITTVGSPAPAMGPRGINGRLDQVLFPLLHGTLFYVGMDVLPPLAVHGADRVSDDDYSTAVASLERCLTDLWAAGPIAYRYQNRGDYDQDLVLEPHLCPGEEGIHVHTRP
jgi:NAD(P)H dehydrogenase (quinone)